MLFDELMATFNQPVQENNKVSSKAEEVKSSPAFSFPESFDNALESFFSDYLTASSYADRIECGEALLDDTVTLNVFHSLGLTYKRYLEERKKLETGMSIQLNQIGIVESNNENIIQGNKFKGEGLAKKDLSLYEKGQWYLFCCKN